MSQFLYSPKYYYDGRFAPFRDFVLSHGSKVRFSAGEYVVNVNELMHSLYYVTDGVLRFYVAGEDIDGNILEKTIWYIGKDNIFPLYGPVGHACRFEYENQVLIAETDVTAYRFNRADCQQMMRENFDFTTTMLDAYADLAGILLYESLNLLRSSSRRITNFLSMYDSTLKPAGIKLSQEEIAGITGVTLPTVARELKKLRDMGVITTARKRIIIKDRDKLMALVTDAALEDGPES